MKKILLALILCMVSISGFVSCSNSTIKLKNGKQELVVCEVYNQTNKSVRYFNNEINRCVNELYNKCNYPVTFVPTYVKITPIKGQFVDGYKVTVTGYAKNGFGVENIVEYNEIIYK